jgi:hypothetical protein
MSWKAVGEKMVDEIGREERERDHGPDGPNMFPLAFSDGVKEIDLASGDFIQPVSTGLDGV